MNIKKPLHHQSMALFVIGGDEGNVFNRSQQVPIYTVILHTMIFRHCF